MNTEKLKQSLAKRFTSEKTASGSASEEVNTSTIEKLAKIITEMEKSADTGAVTPDTTMIGAGQAQPLLDQATAQTAITGGDPEKQKAQTVAPTPPTQATVLVGSSEPGDVKPVEMYGISEAQFPNLTKEELGKAAEFGIAAGIAMRSYLEKAAEEDQKQEAFAYSYDLLKSAGVLSGYEIDTKDESLNKIASAIDNPTQPQYVALDKIAAGKEALTVGDIIQAGAELEYVLKQAEYENERGEGDEIERDEDRLAEDLKYLTEDEVAAAVAHAHDLIQGEESIEEKLKHPEVIAHIQGLKKHGIL